MPTLWRRGTMAVSCEAAGDCHSGKRKIGQEVAFGRSSSAPSRYALRLLLSFCNPETRQQGFIEPNCCRNTAAGADDPIFHIVNTSDIVITSGIVNARPSHPSHQFG